MKDTNVVKTLIDMQQSEGNDCASWGAAKAQWIRLRLPSGCPGLSPKHAIYAFIIYRQICAIFVKRKERKNTKRPGLSH